MPTIFGYSPTTQEGFYLTDATPDTTLVSAGFAATGTLLGNQADGSTPEIYARPGGSVPDATVVGILERSLSRVVSGTPWTRSGWTKVEAIQWAQAHPAAVAFAAFKP